MKNSTPIQVLGLDKLESENDLNKAKKKLILQYHPDRFQGDDVAYAEDITSIINSSVQEVLSNWDTYAQQLTLEDEGLLKKGVTYQAAVGLTAKQMRNGTEIEVTPFGIENASPIKVTIPPNTVADTVIVFEGLGGEGETLNGDLIVICVELSKGQPKDIEIVELESINIMSIYKQLPVGNTKVSLPTGKKANLTNIEGTPAITFIRGDAETGTKDSVIFY